MNHGITTQEQIDDIDRVLREELIDSGVICAILIDTSGNVISTSGSGEATYDIPALAALAAGNFASIDAMAKLVGEKEFAFQYHKGENINIHFSKVQEDILLITMFNSQLSLGFLRLKVADAIVQIQNICWLGGGEGLPLVAPGGMA